MAVPSSGELRLNGDINLEINGTGTGTNVSLNGLASEAGFSAPNGMFEFYGYSNAVLPSVTTNAATNVDIYSMTINGNVTNDGGATVTSRGFYFGTSSNYASNPKYTVGSGTGAFSLARTGLTQYTNYYITAWAINSVGEKRGSTVTQRTNAIPYTPTVATTYGNRYFRVGIETIGGQYIQYLNPNTNSYNTYQYLTFGYGASKPLGIEANNFAYTTTRWYTTYTSSAASMNYAYYIDRTGGYSAQSASVTENESWGTFYDTSGRTQWSSYNHPGNIYVDMRMTNTVG